MRKRKFFELENGGNIYNIYMLSGGGKLVNDDLAGSLHSVLCN